MKKTAHINKAKKTPVTAKSLGQRTGRRLVSPAITRTWQILTGPAPAARPPEQEEVSMHAITTDGAAEENPICLRKMALEARAREGERILHAARFQEILTETLDKIEFTIGSMPPNDVRAAKMRDIISRARRMSQEVG